MFYNRRVSRLKLLLQDLGFFIRDALSTFLYFSLHPFQYLFLNFPKTYDKLLLFLSAIRNVIPTKQEIKITIYYWQYLVCVMLLYIIRKTIKELIKFGNHIIVLVNSNLSKSSKIYY